MRQLPQRHRLSVNLRLACSKELHAKIGELTLQNDFLSGALGKAGLLSAKR
jgi:hypothetical protein